MSHVTIMLIKNNLNIYRIISFLALFAAVEHGHVDKARTILESTDVDVNRWARIYIIRCAFVTVCVCVCVHTHTHTHTHIEEKRKGKGVSRSYENWFIVNSERAKSKIYIRGVLPRIRYDELIYICWKIILPLVLRYIFIIFGVKFFIEAI